MMRKMIAALAVLGLAAAGAGLSATAGLATEASLPGTSSEAIPYVPGPCSGQPGDELFNRPASCQRIRYLYGPVHVTPGDNLILAGPVTIEQPRIDGHIVRFKPDLIRLDGTVPPIEHVHLHHAVWLSNLSTEPIFAAGEEKTIIRLPDGYGLRNRPTDVWVLNYMVHNQLPVPDNVFITYELDVIPMGTAQIKDVKPYWIDVAGYNGFNPVYNTQRGFGTNGECSFPKQECARFDPYGKTLTGQGRSGNGSGESRSIPAGTVVWMQGHVHPGGLRMETSLQRGNQTTDIFTSNAHYYDPGGPISWDMSMEVTPPNFRLRVNSGDRFVSNSVYESAKASWYEGMGITIMYSADGDTSGRNPFEKPFDPSSGVLTHGHMPEADNHGGPDRGEAFTSLPTVQTTRVSIAGFAYLPGNAPGGLAPIPSVQRGQSITFDNFDAASMIYHTVTECKNPCNGPTGISYPLANGNVDFDSLELGYGIPTATAAANRHTYVLPTSSMQPGIYTYFCRVHPFMRGGFEVR